MTDANNAPLHTEIEGVPEGGSAFWVNASDGTRIRFAVWQGGTRGTVLLFPGRTEYIEKYGYVVERLTSWGLNVVVIDWRGQGLSDRPVPGKNIGHVGEFSEYQSDLAAVLAHKGVESLPGPRLLMSHSMGGCIALRALCEGLDVVAAVFSAPMWGIKLPAKPIARAVIWLGSTFGFAKSFAPMTNGTTYVLSSVAKDNILTSDADVFAALKAQAEAMPELTLGAPSLGWLDAAHNEVAALAKAEAPKGPILTFLGDRERIVDPAPIHSETKRQPNAELVMCPGAEHEIWMESPAIQGKVWEKIEAFIAPYLKQ